jgi:hypothetical protein
LNFAVVVVVDLVLLSYSAQLESIIKWSEKSRNGAAVWLMQSSLHALSLSDLTVFSDFPGGKAAAA